MRRPNFLPSLDVLGARAAPSGTVAAAYRGTVDIEPYPAEPVLTPGQQYVRGFVATFGATLSLLSTTTGGVLYVGGY
jgi:fructose-1,6-bisphosphatase